MRVETLPSTKDTPVAIARAFGQLADIADTRDDGSTTIRIGRVDGSTIEGRLYHIEVNAVMLVDAATGTLTQIAATDIRSLEVKAPRRSREWLLAILGIVVAVFALAGYAMLPWVRPKAEADIMIGFILLVLLVGPMLSIALKYTPLGPWLTRWKPLFPPPGA